MKRDRNNISPSFLKKINAIVMKQRQIALSESKMEKVSTTTEHVTEVSKIENYTEYVTLDCIQASIGL